MENTMEIHEEKIEAFKGLLAIHNLPKDGAQALHVSKQFSKVLLQAIRPPPVVTQLLQQYAASRSQPRFRFIDVSTAMDHPATCMEDQIVPRATVRQCLDPNHWVRLRYAEWRGGEDVVLLLHGMGESCEVWAPCAEKLQQRGYRVFALDLRGHGESQWSSGGRYSLDLMAEDIQAFILEKDLYTRPLAVMGRGLGAAVGLTLAQQSPHLVGAAVVAEWAVPAAVQTTWKAAQQPGDGVGAALVEGVENGQLGRSWGVKASNAPHAAAPRQRTDAVREGPAAAAGGRLVAGWGGGVPILDQQQRGTPAAGGKGPGGPLQGWSVMPWCCFSPLQGCSFYSMEECVSLLCHPLMNVGPEALLLLTQAAAAAAVAVSERDVAVDEEGKNAGTQKDVLCIGGEASEGGEAKEASRQAGPGSTEKGGGGQAKSGTQLGKSLQEVLQGLQRPLGGGVCSALAVVRGGGLKGGYIGGWDSSAPGWGSEEGGLSPRMDPKFFLSFDAAIVLSRMAALRCHLLVLRGGASAWVGAEDATCFAALAAGAAASARAATIPAASHHLATDHEGEFLAEVIKFLEGPAIASFDTLGPSMQGGPSAQSRAASRRPELLDLKPLPQFESLDQARKALGPRSVPTLAAVEAELRKLRAEEGGEPSDEEEEGNQRNPYQTALAKDPPDYFGFVG